MAVLPTSFLSQLIPQWKHVFTVLNHVPSSPKTVSPFPSSSSSLPTPPPSSNTPNESSSSKTTTSHTSTMVNSTSIVSVVKKVSPPSEVFKPSKSNSLPS